MLFNGETVNCSTRTWSIQKVDYVSISYICSSIQVQNRKHEKNSHCSGKLLKSYPLGIERFILYSCLNPSNFNNMYRWTWLEKARQVLMTRCNHHRTVEKKSVLHQLGHNSVFDKISNPVLHNSLSSSLFEFSICSKWPKYILKPTIIYFFSDSRGIWLIMWHCSNIFS